jgi:hypothetical protein
MGSFILRLCRPLLLAATLDSLLMGLWAVVYPAGLFALLGLSPPRDAFLWQVLGGLLLTHTLCLALAVWRPGVYAGLVLAPLSGRALACGLWLGFLGTDRVLVPAELLVGLLVHDAVWLPLFVAFLWVARPPGGGRRPCADAC